MGMIGSIKEEIKIIRERDPAIHSSMEVFLYPSFKVMMHYRIAHKLYESGHYFWARWVSQRGVRRTGIEIHPGAKIGRGVLIDHGMGVVIGETAEVGDGCTIYQGVTLGGTGKDKGKRHPTLGKNVTVGCGAKILGPFRVEDGAKIAANAVVLSPLPANSTAVGVPARVVRIAGRKPEGLDHIHTPDPVSQQLCRLEIEMNRLTNRIMALEKEKEEKENKVEA